jgi:hypothetical protein
MKRKSIYTIYALEEKSLLDNFIQQSKKEKIEFDLVFMEEKEPLKEDWRNDCLARIRECDGVIVLISPLLKISEGAFWEMKFSKEANKPMVCVFAGNAGIIDKPIDVRGVLTMVLYWERLNDFFSTTSNP